MLQSISEQYRVAAESEKLARVVRLGFEDFEELDDHRTDFLLGAINVVHLVPFSLGEGSQDSSPRRSAPTPATPDWSPHRER